jgi:uncharacterized membrane protein YhaH (DUF805 family)
MKWFLKCLSQYADFNGRARRKEYWMFILFGFIFGVVAGIIDATFGTLNYELGIGLIGGILSFALFIPSIAVSVRRLHDIGKSGWMLLIAVIPIIGSIWLFILYISDSTEANSYGENPKDMYV